MPIKPNRLPNGRANTNSHYLINGGTLSNATEDELKGRLEQRRLMSELLGIEDLNVEDIACLSTSRQLLSRILYFDRLYRRLVGIPGYVVEFGVRWGNNLNLLTHLRGIYEPYNYNRQLVGFDTFRGFLDVDTRYEKFSKPGDYAVAQDWKSTLSKILAASEGSSPISHISKFELVEGDVQETLPKWLEANPGIAVGMCIFDLDLYRPTKVALELIVERFMKGTILVFDEFSYGPFAGETVAIMESLGLGQLKFQHDRNQPACAWAVWKE